MDVEISVSLTAVDRRKGNRASFRIEERGGMLGGTELTGKVLCRLQEKIREAMKDAAAEFGWDREGVDSAAR
jgi:hypothetical protein